MKAFGVTYAGLLAMFFFGMVIWVYEVGLSYFVPQYLNANLTHYNVFPLNIRNDLCGIIAFASALVSFFALMLMRYGDKNTLS